MRATRIAQLEAELAAFHAECDKVFIPHDAEGLVRHHRNNAAFAAACESEARALRAEALVSTLGSALEDLAFWFRRLAEDEHWNMEDGVMAHEAETKTDAALASYQEWDRANPSTGEGTE